MTQGKVLDTSGHDTFPILGAQSIIHFVEKGKLEHIQFYFYNLHNCLSDL